MEKNHIKLSVVVPVYNSVKTLNELAKYLGKILQEPVGPKNDLMDTLWVKKKYESMMHEGNTS